MHIKIICNYHPPRFNSTLTSKSEYCLPGHAMSNKRYAAQLRAKSEQSALGSNYKLISPAKWNCCWCTTTVSFTTNSRLPLTLAEVFHWILGSSSSSSPTQSAAATDLWTVGRSINECRVRFCKMICQPRFSMDYNQRFIILSVLVVDRRRMIVI